MQSLVLSKYKNIIFNQIRLKIIKKNYNNNFFKNISICIFYQNIDSFKNFKIIESLFLLKLYTKQKSHISRFKKKFKSNNIVLNINLEHNQKNYFLLMWLIFFYPIFKRRNITFKNGINKLKLFTLSNNSYNIFPFFPNIYFSWTKNIIYNIKLFYNDISYNKLLLSYSNFLLPYIKIWK